MPRVSFYFLFSKKKKSWKQAKNVLILPSVDFAFRVQRLTFICRGFLLDVVSSFLRPNWRDVYVTGPIVLLVVTCKGKSVVIHVHKRTQACHNTSVRNPCHQVTKYKEFLFLAPHNVWFLEYLYLYLMEFVQMKCNARVRSSFFWRCKRYSDVVWFSRTFEECVCSRSGLQVQYPRILRKNILRVFSTIRPGPSCSKRR